MPYRALVVKVMVVSPKDCDRQRTLIRALIHEWNVMHSQDRNLVLLPVGWDTHSAPLMGERAQEIINRQVLADCDLLVSTFWTRLGTPTGNSSSGSVEEIRTHLKAGKPAMIYFSLEPLPQDADRAQFDALQTFKAECREGGLVQEFRSDEDLKDTFRRQLFKIVSEHFKDPAQDAPRPTTEDKPSSSLPAISSDAKGLLAWAARSATGVITVAVRIGDGAYLQTQHKDFGETRDAYTEARWNSALNELLVRDLIEPLGPKRDRFKCTYPGFVLGRSFE